MNGHNNLPFLFILTCGISKLTLTQSWIFEFGRDGIQIFNAFRQNIQIGDKRQTVGIPADEIKGLGG
jgi:hypothetical protein